MDAADLYPEILRPYDPRNTPLPPPTQGICDPGGYCIYVEQHWWSHINGMIARLLYRDAWEGTDDEIDRAISQISKILNVGALTMGCGCGGSGLPSRVNSDGVYQVSYDGGTTWVDAPQLDPRTSATLPPPLGGADGDDKRCSAANNVVRQMKDAQAAFSNQLESDKTILEMAIAIAGAIALVIFSGVTLAPILIPLVVELASGILNLTKADYDALFTSDVWDYALCQFYCGADAQGTFTASAFNDILANFDSHFSGNLALSLSSTLKGWQVTGLNSAARIPTTDNLDCSGCDCPEAAEVWALTALGTYEQILPDEDGVYTVTGAFYNAGQNKYYSEIVFNDGFTNSSDDLCNNITFVEDSPDRENYGVTLRCSDGVDDALSHCNRLIQFRGSVVFTFTFTLDNEFPCE